MRWTFCIRMGATALAWTLTESSHASTEPQERPRYFSSQEVSDAAGGTKQWISLHPGVEFLSSSEIVDTGLDVASQMAQEQFPLAQPRRRLQDDEEEEEDEEASSSSSTKTEDNSQYRVQPFVDGVSDYDAYQQAWRLLGFMIDCNNIQNSYSNNNNNNNQHSGDNSGTGEGCTRYVLWAAYVDLNYEGGGIGEYQFYDPSTKSWDTSTCDYVKKVNGGSKRCAKMDCHLKNTHWSLLGFFKHKEIDEWMGQLFKHEGVCVWDNEQYNFMKNARNAWPESCTDSGTTTSSGQSIYYDIKPVHGGGITMGLYTDTKCVKEYQSSGRNDPISLENVVGNFLVNNANSHSNDKNKNEESSANYQTLSEALSAWDSAFSVWMQCQPCVAYDRFNYGYSVNDDNYRGSNYNTYRYGYDDDYAWENYYSKKYSSSDFDCYDDADYTNVNQCMKFMAKTTMNTATFRDLAVATAQGTLVDQPLAGYYTQSRHYSFIRHSALGTYLFLAFGLFIMCYGIYKFFQAKKKMSKTGDSEFSWNPKEPLVYA